MCHHNWCTVMPCQEKAIPMKSHHVIDFKQFVDRHCPNLKNSTSGQRIIQWIQLWKECELYIWQRQIPDKKTLKNTRDKEKDLSMCYQSKLPISNNKKIDLLNYARRKLFLRSLPVTIKHYLLSKHKKIIILPIESEDEDIDNECKSDTDQTYEI